ncbi:hypothetical protein HZA33_01720 [Candidatus Pacearchaeota archaeon]|nr:hypothetical protein [Candidatus Pacearchaeota archaeon]
MLALSPGLMVLFVLVMLWSLVWKGIALWKAGNNKQLTWFVVLFIVNTVGILEIVYLVWFQKKKRVVTEEQKPRRKRR